MLKVNYEAINMHESQSVTEMISGFFMIMVGFLFGVLIIALAITGTVDMLDSYKEDSYCVHNGYSYGNNGVCYKINNNCFKNAAGTETCYKSKKEMIIPLE